MTTSLRFSNASSSLALRFGASEQSDPPVDIPAIGSQLMRDPRMTWSSGAGRSASQRVAWNAAGAETASLNLTWRRAVSTEGSASGKWSGGVSVSDRAVASWNEARQLAAVVAASSRTAQVASLVVASAWASGKVARVSAGLAWGQSAGLIGAVSSAWYAANRAAHYVRMSAQSGAERRMVLPLSWQAGRATYSEGYPWEPDALPPTQPPCYVPPAAASVELRLYADLPSTAELRLACGGKAATRRVQVRRVYMVSNDFSLLRHSDNATIPAMAMNLSLDVDSWAWVFRATLPISALPLIEPQSPYDPCVLRAIVNGTEVLVAVESISSERTFESSTVSIGGRGVSSALAEPNSAVGTFTNASAVTSQQLMDAALPAGWQSEWGLTPWTVPAGVWVHQGTPISAAVAIAAAAGGYIQPHATLQTLKVLPLYPTAPWEWSATTPDVELPSAVIVTESVEWIDRARYNRVFVSGLSSGVIGQVTRAGTAGDIVAPMVADALITHAIAARQRGLSILANTGRQANVTLRLPVLPETGLITPGQLIRYVDGGSTRTGLSRSLSVDVSESAIWQSVRIETNESL